MASDVNVERLLLAGNVGGVAEPGPKKAQKHTSEPERKRKLLNFFHPFSEFGQTLWESIFREVVLCYTPERHKFRKHVPSTPFAGPGFVGPGFVHPLATFERKALDFDEERERMYTDDCGDRMRGRTRVRNLSTFELYDYENEGESGKRVFGQVRSVTSVVKCLHLLSESAR